MMLNIYGYVHNTRYLDVLRCKTLVRLRSKTVCVAAPCPKDHLLLALGQAISRSVTKLLQMIDTTVKTIIIRHLLLEMTR